MLYQLQFSNEFGSPSGLEELGFLSQQRFSVFVKTLYLRKYFKIVDGFFAKMCVIECSIDSNSQMNLGRRQDLTE